ncbi:MAG TPA: peptidylprolyl isomerase [Verrucomicrobiae bacterium]|jgi:parvulin-like peptidyl-prolyl isomerase|nr:peptidylprolyl isomerase [Verrucomicrobiae bacterium]
MKLKPVFFTAIAASVAAGAAIFAISTHAAAPDTTVAADTNSMASLFPDPTIASGTGVHVKRSELDEVVTSIKSAAAAQGETIPPEKLALLEAQALEQMIDVQLLVNQANDADKATGEKKADTAMAALLKRAGSQDMLKMQLTAAGTSADKLHKKVADEATAMAALQRGLGVNVSDAEVQKFYDDHPQEFEQPEMVHVRHILFMTIDPQTREPLADDVVSAKLKLANQVLAKAKGGADFAKLAEQYSDDTTTKEDGGDLPPFPRATADPRRAMATEFEAAAFSLTNNQISDLVKTVYGYHIIQLINKVPAKKLTLSDKIPQTETTVAEGVKDGLTQQKTQTLAEPYLVKLKKTADVKILDPDLNAAVEQLSNTNTPASAPGAAPAN